MSVESKQCKIKRCVMLCSVMLQLTVLWYHELTTRYPLHCPCLLGCKNAYHVFREDSCMWSGFQRNHSSCIYSLPRPSNNSNYQTKIFCGETGEINPFRPSMTGKRLPNLLKITNEREKSYSL